MNRKVIILALVSAATVVAVMALRKRFAVQRAAASEKAAAVAPGERLSIDVDAGEPVLKPE